MAASSASPARLMARTKGREKLQLSCNFCRKRKLRCDRKQPCESCVKLGQAATCSFPFPQLQRTQGHGPVDPGIQNTFHGRIDHLESLVRSLVEKQQDKTATLNPRNKEAFKATASDDEEVLTHNFGRINLQVHESSYVESNHWMAILDEISDLKDLMGGQSDCCHHQEDPQRSPEADLFLFQTYPITKMQILAAIPPRLVVDSMITKYFDSADMPVSLVIHHRVFLKQYEDFWADPLAFPIMWVTILFGMMFMAAYSTLFVDGGLDKLDKETLVEYQEIVKNSREKMIQCLRMGNYMKGTPHTIEALLSFLQVEYIQAEDTQERGWQLAGVIIRVALKMGYHRDGSHFPEMSAFEAEMRRRTWHILTQFDTASASQIGLPRMIKQAQCDTAEPRNLLDDDFDDTTAILPPARPQTEHTLSQFLAYKSRVVSVYGMVCDFTTSSRPRNYDEAMSLHKMLDTAYAQKPPVLELKPMHESIMDGPDLITRRVYMAMSYYHAQMTLHRKFIILAKTNSKYGLSHTVCIGAAFNVLRLQGEMFEQCQPGRILHADRWKILMLIQSEFLLATTILCVNLDDDIRNMRQGKSPLSSDEIYQRSVSALQSSKAIWKQQEAMSKEAQTAVKAISVILNKAHRAAGVTNVNSMSPSQLGINHLWDSPIATAAGDSGNIRQGQDVDSIASRSFSDESMTHVSSSSDFYPSLFQENMSACVPSDLQTDINDGAWSELFDMDMSWDAWSQLQDFSADDG
ncbi:hypothetical protein SUNI508_12792 [Seiridium unicorne]|uniref:Zn(2)-C6 fungal-type domain-containing protein n=1 Tax=Seiridium unicorne TaxID=138068 RepID=A0ABR2VG62_9PEZI